MKKQNNGAFNRRPWLARALLALVALLIVDFVAASVLTWNRRRLSPNIKEQARPYGFGLKPNRSVFSAIWGHRLYELHTNSLGFRDRAPRDVPLQSDAYRLLFIGDSFTMGIGCEYEDSFVGRIDRALRPAGVDVLNAAVDGYSTIHYRKKCRHYIETVGLDVDRVVCCLDMSDIVEDLRTPYLPRANDDARQSGERAERQENMRQRQPRLANRANWKTALRSHSLLIDLAFRIKLAVRPDLPLNEECALWSSKETAYERYGKQGMDIAMRNMDALHRFLRERDIALTIVVYPWADQIVLDDRESRQVTLWRAWARERNVHFINCFPAFFDKYEDPMDAVDAWFIRGDAHFNEAGNEILAEAIRLGLKSRRIGHRMACKEEKDDRRCDRGLALNGEAKTARWR